MNEESMPISIPPAPPQKLQTDLKSIRSMLTFFAVVLILWIILQIFT